MEITQPTLHLLAESCTYLSEHRQSAAGGPLFHWRFEVSAVDKVDDGEDAVKVAVLDVETEVGCAARGAHVVRHHGVPRGVLLRTEGEVTEVNYWRLRATDSWEAR